VRAPPTPAAPRRPRQRVHTFTPASTAAGAACAPRCAPRCARAAPPRARSPS